MPPHCDAKDGPVVKGAIHALETRNVEEALRFVPESADQEVRAAFDRTIRARQSPGAAREIADTYFAETVVRLHRAGEGAPYTGLKPAGLEHGPVIPVAEEAIETGSPEELLRLLSDELMHQVKMRLEHVAELKARAGDGLQTAREYTQAMLGFQVWSHKLYAAMKAAAHEEVEAVG